MRSGRISVGSGAPHLGAQYLKCLLLVFHCKGIPATTDSWAFCRFSFQVLDISRRRCPMRRPMARGKDYAAPLTTLVYTPESYRCFGGVRKYSWGRRIGRRVLHLDDPADRLYIRLQLRIIVSFKTLAFFGLLIPVFSPAVFRGTRTRLPGLAGLRRSVCAGGSRARFLRDPKVDSRTESALSVCEEPRSFPLAEHTHTVSTIHRFDCLTSYQPIRFDWRLICKTGPNATRGRQTRCRCVRDRSGVVRASTRFASRRSCGGHPGPGRRAR